MLLLNFKFFLKLFDFRCFWGSPEDTKNNAERTNEALGTNYDSKGNAHGTETSKNEANEKYEQDVVSKNEESKSNDFSDLDSKLDALDSFNLGGSFYDPFSNTVYGYDSDSSWSVTYGDSGIIESAYGSINNKIREFENGVSSSFNQFWYGNSVNAIGYSSETGLAGDVSVANEFMSALNIGGFSLDTSLFGDISVNGYSLGLFSAVGYKIDGIKLAQVVEGLSLGVSFYTGLQSFKMGMGLASFGLKGIGHISATTGGYSMYSSLVAATSLFGSSTPFAISTAKLGSFRDGDVTGGLLSNIENASKETEAKRRMLINNYTDIATGTIFDRFAGGVLYDIKSAGNDFFDASDINNPKVLVGENLNISKFSRRINTPYKEFSFPKLAGSDNWSVLNT
jgi:hypothetical protein